MRCNFVHVTVEILRGAGLAGKGSDAALAALFRVADSKIDHIWLSNDVPKTGAYAGVLPTPLLRIQSS